MKKAARWKNDVVIRGEHVMGRRLAFKEEFVLQTILDIVGDLALCVSGDKDTSSPSSPGRAEHGNARRRQAIRKAMALVRRV